MKTIIKGVKGFWYWFWGHLFAIFIYDGEYLRGRWFSGKMKGLCSTGWKWVVHDAMSRFFTGDNKPARFPVAHGCRVVNPDNIVFHPDDLNNFQTFGVYFQAIGKITIGHGSYIGPNVGLITANHDFNNLDVHLPPKPIIIGEKCWIGMNSIVLGGVTLGNNTIVGAGSIVTKSFPEGNCIIVGNPARKIKDVEQELVE